MLIYIDEILGEIKSIREYAKIIKKKFKQGRPSEELLLDVEALDKRLEYLFSILPDGIDTGYTERHVNFMKHFLQKDQPDRCEGDIWDIVKSDLPGIKKSFKRWANDLQYVDADLRKEISTLVKTNQFDSAIRKAFVIFKTRLCDKFGLDHSLDGESLVNRIFGEQSPYLTDLPPKQKKAYRNYYSGLFGLMRNRYAHEHVDATLSELDMAISSINYGLKMIDDFRDIETDGENE